MWIWVMKSIMKRNSFILAFALGFMALPLTAIAEPNSMRNDALPVENESQVMSDMCYSLDDNAEWKDLFAKFSDAYQKKHYDQALSYTRDLQHICDRSPILNYSIGTTFREMGNMQEALHYYRRATGNKEFNISNEMLQKFWYAQYEVENANLICAQSDLDACMKKGAEYKERLEGVLSEHTDLQTSYQQYIDEQHHRDAVVMWTGAGIGIVGIAAAATGGALLAANNNPVSKVDISGDGKSSAVHIKTMHYVSVAMLSAGAGLAVAGIIMTGIGGYHYTHPLSDNVTASWAVSPNNFEFDLTF